MLIIPLDRKIDWKQPPVVTFLLLVLNLLGFFLFQLDDIEQEATALDYYRSSGLAKIEWPLYRAFLREQQGIPAYEDLPEEPMENSLHWVVDLQTNARFLDALHADRIIGPDAEGYLEWREKRRNFERLYEDVTYIGYGLRTAKPSVITFFSHMFLHAGFMHLFGNAVFLVAIGLLVEATLGRAVFLGSYLLGGLGSAAFYYLIDGGSLLPAIGASGAIAGLMGMYAVLYGMRRVRFFYFIGVYFDYIRLPAIILLPLWIGNELMQMALYPDSNINFVAHLGGLLSGGAIGVFVRRLAPSYSLDFLAREDRQKAFDSRLDKARDLCRRMDYRGALPILRSLYRQDPDNREVLCRFHECSRMNPADDEYHRLSRAILALDTQDPGTRQLVVETYREYLRLARPKPRIPGKLLCGLTRHLLGAGAVEEAETLIRIIRRKKIACSGFDGLMREFSKRAAATARFGDQAHYPNPRRPGDKTG